MGGLYEWLNHTHTVQEEVNWKIVHMGFNWLDDG